MSLDFADCRIISIWNKEGVICYVSEQVNGLESRLSWKPEGNLITASQQCLEKHLIIFFEKNGLRHGQFELPVPASCFIIHSIKWSCDSKVLLIHGIDTSKKEEYIYLYTARNYYYYLKQTFAFKLDEQVATVFWDPNVALKLHLFLTSGNYQQFELAWDVCSNEGTVAVIDGNNLQITPFETTVIPPPLYAFSLECQSQINAAFLSQSKYLLILLNKIILIELATKSSSSEKHNQLAKIKNGVRSSLLGKLNFNSFETHMIDLKLKHLRHLFMINNYQAIGVVFCKPFHDQLVSIDFESNNIQSLCQLPSQVKVLDCDTNNGLVALELTNKKIFKFELKSNTLSPWTLNADKELSLPKLCDQIKICYIQSKPYIIGHSWDFKLFLNNQTLSTKCSSFILTPFFLVTTTTDNILQTWRLNDSLLQESPSAVGDEERKLERGATLVTSVDKDGSVLLQMPRGNLELIWPRILLIYQLKQLLNNNQFEKAFKIMKRHRINLNLLVDHNPALFFENASSIIESIGSKDVQDICVFLSELEEKDVRQSLYLFAYQDEVRFNYESTKLNFVCYRFRQLMMKKDKSKYLIPILFTFVKQTDSSIDKALLMIKNLTSTQQQDMSLKYLLYLIDENRLYNEALGTYDFDIVLMVAERSQKDPKEYKLFLENLSAIKPLEYRKYKIDLHLKRYSKALKHLKMCKDERYLEECLEVIETQHLYSQAVKIFDDDNDKWCRAIWVKYGNYLMIKKYFMEAGFAFRRGNDIQNAVKAFQIGGKWNEAIETALQLDDISFKSTCLTLILNLESNGKYQEAAYICEVYLNEVSRGIMILIKGHVWDAAQRLIQKSAHFELIINLKRELLEQYESLIELINDNIFKFNTYTKRLEVVRSEIRTKNLNSINYEGDEMNDFVSETSSLSSTRKSKTSGSLTTCKSKSKKKQNLKRYVLKEGSAFEDLALMFTIKQMIETVEKDQTEVALIIPTLFNHGYFDQANTLQSKFTRLIELIQTNIKIVWPMNEANEIGNSQMCLNDVLSQTKSYENRYLKGELYLKCDLI